MLKSAIPTIVNGAASRATAAVSSVIDDATKRIGEVLPTGCSVGTKYVCVELSGQSSCVRMPSLEVVLLFGLSLTLVSFFTFALKFVLPLMGVFTLALSVLGLLFFVVFAASMIFIGEIAFVLADSEAIYVEKGMALPDSIGSLVCAILWVAIAVIELAL